MRRAATFAIPVALLTGLFAGACSSSGSDDAVTQSAPSVVASDADSADAGSQAGPDDLPAAADSEPDDVTDRSLPADNSGGESLGPVGSLDLELNTDEGTVQLGDGEVPESLDPAFPLPDDLAVTISSETAAEVGVSGTTAWPFDDLVALYEDGLPAAGYEISDLRRPTAGVAVFSFARSGESGQVAISAAPNMATTIVVTVSG